MRYLLPITLLACACLGARAQPALPPGVRGADSGMATRSVSHYLGLERELLEALKAGDRAAVLQKLGEDFEFKSASQVDGLAAADWLASELRPPLAQGNVRNLSVSEFNEVAVVSFLLDSKRTAQSKPGTSTWYVVDVWQQSPPRLMARYVSQPRQVPPIPRRPTGKE
jgi:hypothetical protein